jgi:homospermidine synthase
VGAQTMTPPRIAIVGLGNIGEATLPLIKRLWPKSDILVIDQLLDERRRCVLAAFGVDGVELCITRDNHARVLGPLLGPGAMLLNFAVDVCSADLIRLAQAHGAHYLDTCIDPWSYDDPASSLLLSNYALREDVLALAAGSVGQPTAVVAHGANPGFVSVLVKQALHRMGRRFLPGREQAPRDQPGWARLAQDLGVRVIQIAERDSQASTRARAEGEFVNTWSVDGFITECLQPAELGWGTHEIALPAQGRVHEHGSRAAIAIDRPGHEIKVKSWSPNALDFDAWLITHNEAISIADYLTLREGACVTYRPTAYYAYHPCDQAVESMALLGSQGAALVRERRVIKDEIASGIDELGVFVISDRYSALWLGSNLSIGKARKQVPYNSATSLQVASSVVAALEWITLNPRAGIVESEQLDHEFLFERTLAYWSPMVCEYVAWRPRAGSSSLAFAEFLVG